MALTDLMVLFGGGMSKCLELWLERPEGSKRKGLFGGSLGDQSVERNADDGGLLCKVSEGSKDSSIRAIPVIYLT